MTDVVPTGHEVRVLWQPRVGAVQAGVPYRHSYSCRLPDVLSPEFKEFTIACRVPVARFTLRVVSERPVQDAVCYRARAGQVDGNAEDIYLRARDLGRRGAPPPRKIDERTREGLEPSIRVEDHGTVQLKSRSQPVRVFSVVPGS